MSSSALHSDPTSTAAVGAFHDDAETVAISRSRLHELEACELRAELDAQNIQLLEEQLAQAKDALARKEACDERQAKALMEVCRTCDRRVSELEVQHAEKLAKVERLHDAVVTAKDATIVELKKQNVELKASHAQTIAAKDTAAADLSAAFAKLEREQATRGTRAAARLAAVHAAVTSKFALEVHPVRTDRRQFATLHVGPVPSEPLVFDSAWCVAACGDKWKVDIDPDTHMRAHLTHSPVSRFVTLRGATPLLPRCLPPTDASTPPQQFASYRVVIEGYPAPIDGKVTQYCNVGFVPSHTSTDGAPIIPVAEYNIRHYGGWWFQVNRAIAVRVDAGATVHGWTPLRPRIAGAGAGGDVEEGGSSAYATTDVVPVVPVGSAVELAVDYAAGTCRVAFYTPAAVVGDFVEAPYAKMELRFVATDAADVPDGWGAIPARSVPTAAAVDSSVVQLYPAVSAANAGAVLRFV